jgi:hypothetical protein
VYPQRELTRLAGRKTALVERIDAQRRQSVDAASRLLRPVAWCGRFFRFWRQWRNAARR